MNADIKRLNIQISKFWDDNVLVRAQDLEKQSDYSYTQIIMPWVMSMVLKYTKKESHILDIGCGCGYLTNAIFEKGRCNITGIDLSLKSISYAQKRYPQIEFVHQDIYSISWAKKYDLCLAVMVLNNVPDLNQFFQIAKKIVEKDGKLVLIIPHPCFWPQKHLHTKSFSYIKESSYLYQFATKGRKDYSEHIAYFHRSLGQYMNTVHREEFKILDYEELMEMDKDKTPDILGIVLQKM